MNTTDQQLALLKSMRESFHEQGIHCAQRAAQLDTEIAKIKQPAWVMPSPPEGQQWHRMDWTEDMLPAVTDGGLPWRPMLKGEAGNSQNQICAERFAASGVSWTEWSGEEDGDPGYFYRTRLAMPSPPAPPVLWSCIADVPQPWPVMRMIGSKDQYVIMAVLEAGVSIYSHGFYPWAQIKDWQHSTSKENFAPCTK